MRASSFTLERINAKSKRFRGITDLNARRAIAFLCVISFCFLSVDSSHGGHMDGNLQKKTVEEFPTDLQVVAGSSAR